MLTFSISASCNVETQLRRLAVANANSIGVDAKVTTVEDAMRVCSALLTRTNVQMIFFTNNCSIAFTPVFASAVALICLKNTHLKQFYLTKWCAWQQWSLRLLCNALAVHQSLRLLDLCDNNLNCGHAAALAELLCSNTPLRVLSLSGNSIACSGARALANALCSNTHLLELRLDFNQVGADGARALAAYLARKDAALQVLALNDNVFASNGAIECALQRALRTNATLMELRLERFVHRHSSPTLLALKRNASARRRLNQHSLRAHRLYAIFTLLLRSSRVFNDVRQDVHGRMALLGQHLQRDLRALITDKF